ncbi:hypothetical protein CBF68_10185 [Lactobacillus taiwanensis]|uniref:Uncharacterized protein n=1 Tax=Lactobacillus taiwanensis TaxID=508451 RepID=A0A256LKL1_9LACO|nr:hypothetical protein CBF53_01060 [Lactobacillus taiwanensis]OYR93032.1 hypothetical protein CBF70_02195 [Lactobacillus taiwanensis]OYR97135.1 hypothetical protein CBF58_01135 [Lactobacillus taiwanensis]OYR98289.1 hypothetical protein CBF64_09815 [Lactobacillus taiwanensis]OYS00524.1 hypothetical protein CBF68_10185 [Lactobacillus taiwanensis]
MKRSKKQPNVHKNNGCLFLKEGFIMNQKIPNYINQLKRILNVKSIDILGLLEILKDNKSPP